jgi:hypothetical protein
MIISIPLIMVLHTQGTVSSLDMCHVTCYTFAVQGSEPADFIALMDPPTLDPDAQRQNARRASITGVYTVYVATSQGWCPC